MPIDIYIYIGVRSTLPLVRLCTNKTCDFDERQGRVARREEYFNEFMFFQSYVQCFA